MADQQTNWAALIFGGIFLGAWIYGILFTYPEPSPFEIGRWIFWGILGLGIAGGLFAARMANETVRIVIIVLVGVFLGILILAAVLEEDAYIMATFVAGTGAGLIAAALPRGGAPWQRVDEG